MTLFTFDETTDAGRDTGSPVTDAHPGAAANAFSGTIRWIRIGLGKDDHTHQIPADVHLEAAMTRR